MKKVILFATVSLALSGFALKGQVPSVLPNKAINLYQSHTDYFAGRGGPVYNGWSLHELWYLMTEWDLFEIFPYAGLNSTETGRYYIWQMLYKF